MEHGTYFRAETGELLTVPDGADAPEGGGWERVTDETGMGLVGLRRLLLDRGLIDEAGAQDIYWSMPSKPREESTGSRPAAA